MALISCMTVSNRNESLDPVWVTLFIFIADGILCLLVFAGENTGLAGISPPKSICTPWLDNLVTGHGHEALFLIFQATTGVAAIYFNQRIKLRDFLNVLFFIETVSIFGWWTAHTGGLNKSLYGSAYLVLFPVATIVPRSPRIKFIAALSVAIVALIMVCYTPDWGRELFIWISSIVGCSIGWAIQHFLISITERKKPAESP